MRRQDIIAALTQEEKLNLVKSTFSLLCNLKPFEDTKSLVAQLQKFLEQLYQQEPDICFSKNSGGYPSPTNLSCVEYAIACKQIGDIVYFADGKISDGFNTAYLSSWIPTAETQEKLDIKNETYRRDYEDRQTGVAIQKQVKVNIKNKEKSFWNSLLKYRHLFLKYQMCKYLEKRFTVPKRFNSKSTPLWQLAEQLKTAVTFSSEQQKQIASTIEDINTAISQLFYSHDYCSRISVLSFNSQEDIAEADRQKCLDCYDFNRDNNGWLQQVRFWHEDYITITGDPDIEGKILNIRIATLINIIYTLQCYGEKTGGDIKDFLTVLGIIKPQED